MAGAPARGLGATDVKVTTLAARDALSGYRASCPSCGSPVVFELGATLLKVCEHCGTAVARRGADLAGYGKVAALIPTPSVLKLGLEGDYEGAPPFRLVGRLQLDYGAGTWDEWLMAFSDGSWAWLSEAQGRFHYMGQAALPPLPCFDDIRPGQTVDLGPPGTFVVAEVRRARFASAAGELPFAVAPGSELRYADLSGPGGRLATIDYGAGDAAEALYVGREVTLEQLGFHDLPDAEDRRKRVAGEDLKCPQCGGPLEVRAPDQTQRVACPYCGSMLDATQRPRGARGARPAASSAPAIPLGRRAACAASSGRPSAPWSAASPSRASATPGASTCSTSRGAGFRWLVEAKGHWSFVEPVAAGDIGDRYGQPVYGEREVLPLPVRDRHRRPRARASSTGRWRAGTRPRPTTTSRRRGCCPRRTADVGDHLEPRHLHRAGRGLEGVPARGRARRSRRASARTSPGRARTRSRSSSARSSPWPPLVVLYLGDLRGRQQDDPPPGGGHPAHGRVPARRRRRSSRGRCSWPRNPTSR